MSYRCGIEDPKFAALLGTDVGPARITCDGCGVRLLIGVKGLPPKWFFDGKAPPGWRVVRQGEVRNDYCGKCKDDPRKAGHQ